MRRRSFVAALAAFLASRSGGSAAAQMPTGACAPGSVAANPETGFLFFCDTAGAWVLARPDDTRDALGCEPGALVAVPYDGSVHYCDGAHTWQPVVLPCTCPA